MSLCGLSSISMPDDMATGVTQLVQGCQVAMVPSGNNDGHALARDVRKTPLSPLGVINS